MHSSIWHKLIAYLQERATEDTIALDLLVELRATDALTALASAGNKKAMKALEEEAKRQADSAWRQKYDPADLL